MKAKLEFSDVSDGDQAELCSMQYEDYINNKELFLYLFKEDCKNLGIGSALLAPSKNPQTSSWETLDFEFTPTKTSIKDW